MVIPILLLSIEANLCFMVLTWKLFKELKMYQARTCPRGELSHEKLETK